MTHPPFFDNKARIVKDDLVATICSGDRMAEAALTAIARANKQRLLFACTRGEEACLALYLGGGGLVVGPWRPAEGLALRLDPAGMDQTWDLMASQAAHGDEGRAGETVEGRHAIDERIARLKDQLANVDAKRKRERQFARRNKLFDEANVLREQIRQLEEGRD